MTHGFELQPLVGRDDVLASVLASVQRPAGHGAVVVADAGMGKSALAGVVAAQLEGRIPIHRIHTSSSLSAVPYGALAPLIAELDPRDTDSPIAVMRALLHQLFPDGSHGTGDGGGQDPAHAPLVIVDDAEALDGQAADLLAQLVASARIRILVLTRRISDISEGLSHQIWEGTLSRHELLPLTEDQIHELCVQALGGPVLTGTSTDLARASGGNPMLALALLSETVRTGSLIFRRGIWLLHEQVLTPGGRLGDLLRAQLADLTEEERDALEIIALAEPLPAATAFRLGHHSAVDSLTQARLVSLSADPARLLRPMHPLYGEVIRRMVPAARSARLRRRVLAVGKPTTGGENLLRWVCWSLDCGETVSDAELVNAAYRANNIFDSAAALRAAGAVKGPDHAVAARVQAARACFQDGSMASAADLLAGATETAADLTTVKMAVLIRVQLSIHNNGYSPALASIARDWQAAVDRIERTSETHPEADPELAADIASSRRGACLLALMAEVAAGNFNSAEEQLDDILAAARDAGDEEAILIGKALLSELMAATGRVRGAARLSRDAMAILTRGGQSFLSYYQFVLHRRLVALSWTGEWTQMQDTVQRGMGGMFGSLVHIAGVVDFAVGIMHLRTSKPAAALTHFAAAVEGLRTHDPEGLLPLAIALGAFVAASERSSTMAEELLAEGSALEPRGAAPYRLLAKGYLAAAASVLAMDAQPPASLQVLAAEAEKAGFISAEFELRFLSLSLGDQNGLNRLRKISGDFEGPQARVLDRFARAVLDEDAEELARFGTETVEPGWKRLAERCAAEALRLAKANGDAALLLRVQRILSKKAGDAPVQRLSPGAPVLTRRERDVASLVMQGYRNAEIAERLSLSVRTVEGHIYRTFEKLGISKREELKSELLADRPIT
ncbi:helix-turn-helix transcriptional regulator [Arthrobacter sp. zg-ZUI100]|uniref:LuxR C-terminal-related transcriptional regulator n=1 Tax=Arthrobacter jiangjiafuii TaxID=2817475 RepID=UPI001AED4EA5|nr:helix-turn-helix transcriptional regulator [Arthrobacter jiangjiafuii]